MSIRNLTPLILIIISAATFMQCSTILSGSANRTNQKFSSNVPYDVIIVPGYPHNEEKWERVIEMRMIWAKNLYDKGITKNIMFSGGAVYTPYVESKVMAKYAIAMGIPKENVFTEENANHSTENLYYSYVRAKELGFTKIALATDPFQTSSLRMFRNKYKLDVGLLPIVFSELKLLDHTEPEICAENARVENFAALDSVETFAERWQGTLGNKIRWREEDVKLDKHKRILERRGKLIPARSFATDELTNL